jgi:hypothetical protein
LKNSCKRIALVFLNAILIVLLTSAVLESASAVDSSFFLLEGNHVNLWMPRESVGVNFTEILTKFQTTKVCDIGYDLLKEIVGDTPYSGAEINITGYGYDGAQNAPLFLGLSGNPINIVYDRLSSTNSILGYSPLSGENSLPNYGIYFHELFHDFTSRDKPDQSAFEALYERFSSFKEGFARFSNTLIPRLITMDYEDYGLSPTEAGIMNSSVSYDFDNVEKSFDPNRVNVTALRVYMVSAFLNDVAEDYPDYGKALFTSFFKITQAAVHVLDTVPLNEVECNSLFIASINKAAGSNYTEQFKHYRFDISSSLVDLYSARLKVTDFQNISIEGCVTDFYGTPLSDIGVQAMYHIAPLISARAVTNELGFFSIQNVRPGLFYVLVGSGGYAGRNRAVSALTNSTCSSTDFFMLPGRFIKLAISGKRAQIESQSTNFSGLQGPTPYVGLVENPAGGTTTFHMVAAVDPGDVGIVNMTIPKLNVTYGSIPSLYLNGTFTQGQGIAEDSTNFYVWFNVQPGKSQASIVFSGTSIPELPGSAFATVLMMLLMAIVLVFARLVKRIGALPIISSAL